MLDDFSTSAITYRNQFHIGGVSVEIASERRADVAFSPSLAPFCASVNVSDIEIRIEWIPRLFPSQRDRVFDSGSVWRLYECGDRLDFEFTTPSLGEGPYKRFLIDAGFQSATLQMSEEAFSGRATAADPLDYPLDELLIMHRLTQERAIELHGCGIVRADGIGNLFVGHSGAGKSTTTQLWTSREDVQILSDDRIIVRRDCEELTETPCEIVTGGLGKGILRLQQRPALPVGHFASDDAVVVGQAGEQIPPFRFANPRNDKGSSFPANNGNSKEPSVPRNKQMRMYGTPWHGEAMYASPRSAPLARILILQHGHGNVLTSLSRSEAVAELFARSFVPFHRHEYVDSALNFLEELVEAVPVYRYAFEPDQRAVDTILNLHD